MGMLSRFSIRRLPWYTPIIAMSIVFAAMLTLLLWLLPPRSRSSEWVEVSRGEWLRAVRHTPTSRCFVRYSEGGIVETAAEVCGSSR
jgi:hypothetical protein